MSETKHTPGPIRIEREINLVASDGYSLTGMTGTDLEVWHQRAVANAEHAVRCWNSHDALLAACEKAIEEIRWQYKGALSNAHAENNSTVIAIRAALRRAGEEA